MFITEHRAFFFLEGVAAGGSGRQRGELRWDLRVSVNLALAALGGMAGRER